MATATHTASRRKPTPPPQGAKDKRGHLVGSRKSRVHAAWAEKGEDAAEKLGLRLKLKRTTLLSWFGQWRRLKPKRTRKRKTTASN